MKIELFREGKDNFSTESKIDFLQDERAVVAVGCDEHGCDEISLRREAEAFLNRQASLTGMRVTRAEDPMADIRVRVERGESARVKYLEFPIDILPI